MGELRGRLFENNRRVKMKRMKYTHGNFETTLKGQTVRLLGIWKELEIDAATPQSGLRFSSGPYMCSHLRESEPALGLSHTNQLSIANMIV